MRRACTLAAAVLCVAAAAARAGSLPEVTSGPLPGPPVLHAPLASAPPFENAPPWSAEPLRVSGAEAYVAGEYLWQDWIFDSYGANTTNLPAAPPDTAPASATGAASAPTGDVVYPTDAATYGFDAADLLEVRARLVPGGVAYRVTLNTMLVPDAALVAIGIDTDLDSGTGSDDLGYGTGALGPLGVEHVVATWGSGAELDGAAVPSSVDTTRNQIHVEVPLDPAGATWRHYLVAGLYDAGTGGFKPIGLLPSATEPGGSHLTTPPPVFNVGFRFADQEPMGADPTELGGRGAYFYGGWREHAQAHALAARDISAFHADIDFALLEAEITDVRVPQTGILNRLVVSHSDLGGEGATADQTLGQIQPYAVRIPDDYVPGTPMGVQPILHSAAANYNQMVGSIDTLVKALGRDVGAIVFTPEARGPTVGYAGVGEVDFFEVWADVAHHYTLDPERVNLSGISMGGIGSYRLASHYPDLFGRVMPLAAHGADVTDLADNLYNLPYIAWNGIPDELVPIADVLPYQMVVDALGYRHEQHLFPTRDHLANPIGGEMDFGSLTPFVAGVGVDRDPSRVVYRRAPDRDDPANSLFYDKAYWVSDIAVAPGADSGLVDVRSLARGEGDPGVVDIDALSDDPEPHEVIGKAWQPTAEAPQNTVEAVLTDVEAATLWLDRSGVRLGQPLELHLDSTANVALRLVGSWPSPVEATRDGVPIGTLTPQGGAIEIVDAGVHDYRFAALDADGDGVANELDVCPFAADPEQRDRGGVGTTQPDGIGDACQCGDVSGNGVVNGQDGNAIRRHGLGLSPNPVFRVPGNCDVTGNGACNGQDAGAVRRAALGADAGTFGQHCHNAVGAPLPPDF